MEDTQKQDKLPPIKYTKRVGHLFEHVRDLDNLKEAIKDAARHKRKRKEVQKVLEDIDGHALELQRMLDEETFILDKTTIRKSIMLRISWKARTIARAAYASIRNAHAMVSYIGYIVNSDSQRFYENWVRPFVNIKHLKGVIADEDRKQHKACVAV